MFVKAICIKAAFFTKGHFHSSKSHTTENFVANSFEDGVKISCNEFSGGMLFC